MCAAKSRITVGVEWKLEVLLLIKNANHECLNIIKWVVQRIFLKQISLTSFYRIILLTLVCFYVSCQKSCILLHSMVQSRLIRMFSFDIRLDSFGVGCYMFISPWQNVKKDFIFNDCIIQYITICYVVWMFSMLSTEF